LLLFGGEFGHSGDADAGVVGSHRCTLRNKVILKHFDLGNITRAKINTSSLLFDLSCCCFDVFADVDEESVDFRAFDFATEFVEGSQYLPSGFGERNKRSHVAQMLGQQIQRFHPNIQQVLTTFGVSFLDAEHELQIGESRRGSFVVVLLSVMRNASTTTRVTMVMRTSRTTFLVIVVLILLLMLSTDFTQTACQGVSRSGEDAHQMRSNRDEDTSAGSNVVQSFDNVEVKGDHTGRGEDVDDTEGDLNNRVDERAELFGFVVSGDDVGPSTEGDEVLPVANCAEIRGVRRLLERGTEIDSELQCCSGGR